MKQSIYACLFSSGLIKVGRSIDPQSRMASHEERLSCTGVYLVDTHFMDVDGCVIACERELIKRCNEASAKRHKSEWFDGLDFAMVSAWIDEIAAAYLLGAEAANGAMNLNQYLENDGTAAELARKIGISPVLISQWRSGKRPIPVERCPAIERATDGAVTRRDLRPDDWWLIWPELVTEEFPAPAATANKEAA